MKMKSDSAPQESFIKIQGVLHTVFNSEEVIYTNEETGETTVYWESVVLPVNRKEDAYRVQKDYLLNNLIVTIGNGKRFYADPVSRGDLSDAILLSEEVSQTTTNWKTPDGIVEVNLEELKEARRLALEAKANLVMV